MNSISECIDIDTSNLVNYVYLLGIFILMHIFYIVDTKYTLHIY